MSTPPDMKWSWYPQKTLKVHDPPLHSSTGAPFAANTPVMTKKIELRFVVVVHPFIAMARVTAVWISASLNGLAAVPLPPGYAVASTELPPSVTAAIPLRRTHGVPEHMPGYCVRMLR